MTNTNNWKQPLLSDRCFQISRAHRLSTANTNGVEGLSVADRRIQRELQQDNEQQTIELVERRKAAVRHKAKDSLYLGTSWKKKTDSAAAPSKRIAAKDRIAIAQKKIAAAPGHPARSTGRSDSSSRKDSACMLLIDGEPYTQNDQGQWIHVVTGEFHPSSANG